MHAPASRLHFSHASSSRPAVTAAPTATLTDFSVLCVSSSGQKPEPRTFPHNPSFPRVSPSGPTRDGTKQIAPCTRTDLCARRPSQPRDITASISEDIILPFIDASLLSKWSLAFHCESIGSGSRCLTAHPCFVERKSLTSWSKSNAQSSTRFDDGLTQSLRRCRSMNGSIGQRWFQDR